MNISASQAQLLRQLNIRPLQARAGFFPDALVNSHCDPSSSANAALQQPPSSVLTNDIKRMLSQAAITDWQLDPAASACQLANNSTSLITPVLALLQQPELKQQLWLLLQPLLADDAD
ncbi:MAG: hypothetical protein CML20_05920 [Rheinheimera sp.]|uniref:hypothetical protein n=1 Tax=Arsukibacterium sp. UBA3155 TaxID=1946058 RepID=UPI000C903DBD|nr:hypothetical protein [Arsukibacterium sp. UBA3155]MAD74320.1 hypothetical protein [Rheinheimera sp.]|tara:strand:+ start:757 stop:1110 length:354 start_codon:yes stop_codon:yes gene_type:complete